MPPSEYRYPVDVAGPYNVVWSASEPIDLNGRAAELTRAYVESCQLSIFGRQYVYPGAMDAAPPPSLDTSASCLWAPKRPEATKPAYFGTLYAHILEVDVADRRVTARGCYSTNGRAEVETQEPESDELSAIEFSFTARLPNGATDPRENTDRAITAGTGTRAPQFDVFYPWKFDAVRWDKPRPAQSPFKDRPCTQWAVDKLNQVPAFSGQSPFAADGYPNELTPKMFGEEGFPTLPQTPAWPVP